LDVAAKLRAAGVSLWIDQGGLDGASRRQPAEAYTAMGLSYFIWGKLEEASASSRKAIDLAPTISARTGRSAAFTSPTASSSGPTVCSGA